MFEYIIVNEHKPYKIINLNPNLNIDTYKIYKYFIIH